MSKNSIKIDWEQGYNGEYIITVDGNFYCTADNWQELKQVRRELLEQDLLVLCQ